MKKFLAAILILCFAVAVFSGCKSGSKYEQALDMIEDEEYEEAYKLLNEAVHGTENLNECRALLRHFEVVYKKTETITSTLDRSDIYNPKKVERLTTIELDDKGNVILNEERREDTVQYKHTYSYEYDDNGNVSTMLTYDINENLIKKQTYEYDERGLLQLMTAYSPNGEMNSQTKYERQFDDNGYMTDVITYDGKGEFKNHTKREYDKYGNVTFLANPDYLGEIVIKTTYEYDEKGNLLLETKYILDEYREKTEYQYDENGNLTLTTKYSADKKQSPVKVQYKYNENNDLISITELPYYVNGYSSLTKEYVMEYDEKGFLCKKLTYSDSTLIEEITYSDPIVLYHPYID